MSYLIINAGSSSLKFKLFDHQHNLLSSGLIDSIHDHPRFTADGGAAVTLPATGYVHALEHTINYLFTHQQIKDLQDIQAIGHRVVHGGETYKTPVRLTPTVIKKLQDLIPLAPLHNPANLEAIQACEKLFPNCPQVAVFDTAFHQTMPPRAYLYGLPYDLYTEHHVRRYGFHGPSHQYVSTQAIKLLKKDHSKIVTCHLGNGSSITAVHNGESVDTSMGFTPLEGIPMGTRSGSIDPGIFNFFFNQLAATPAQVDTLLNKKSGLLGISGVSADMRDLYALWQKQDPRALRTLELLTYQIAKYIGSYAAAMNGLDAICFTGGLGERAFYVRAMVCDYLTFLGVKIDPAQNEANATFISTPQSPVKVLVIPTNEELQILLATVETLASEL